MRSWGDFLEKITNKNKHSYDSLKIVELKEGNHMRIFRLFRWWLAVLMVLSSCSSSRTIGEAREDIRDSDQGTMDSANVISAEEITPTPVNISLPGNTWLRMLGLTHDRVAVARLENNEVIVWGEYTTRVFDDVKQIAHGTNHTVLLHDNGTISAYGENELGQTNVPETSDQYTKIAAGDTFSVALTNTGRVVGWGQATVDVNGTTYAITPYPPDVTDAVDVYAFGHMTLITHQDGTVSLWGDDETKKAASFSLDGVSNPKQVVISNRGILLIDNQGGVQWFSFYPKNTDNRTQPMVWPSSVARAVLTANESMLLITTTNEVYFFKDSVGISGPLDTKLLSDAPMLVFGQYVLALNDKTELDVLRIGYEQPYVTPWKHPFPRRMENAAELNVKAIGEMTQQTQVIYRYADNTVKLFAEGVELLNYPYSVTEVSWIGDEKGYFSVIAPNGQAVIWGAVDSRRQFIPEWAPALRYIDLPTEYVFSEACTIALALDGALVEWDANGNTPCRFQMGDDPILQGKEMFPRPPAEATNLVKVIRPADKTKAIIGLREDGQVIAWGRYGDNRPATVPVNATDVVDIAQSYTEMLALRRDGQIVMWDMDKGETLAPDFAMPSRMIRVFRTWLGQYYYASLRQDGTLAIWSGDVKYEYPGMSDVVDIDMYFGINTNDDMTLVNTAAASFVALRGDGTITHLGAFLAFPDALRVRMIQ